MTTQERISATKSYLDRLSPECLQDVLSRATLIADLEDTEDTEDTEDLDSDFEDYTDGIVDAINDRLTVLSDSRYELALVTILDFLELMVGN